MEMHILTYFAFEVDELENAFISHVQKYPWNGLQFIMSRAFPGAPFRFLPPALSASRWLLRARRNAICLCARSSSVERDKRASNFASGVSRLEDSDTFLGTRISSGDLSLAAETRACAG
jgi:hypothetical protein